MFGMISEWDFVKRIKGKTGIRVRDIMIKKPLLTKRNYSVFEVSKIMCRGAFKNFPVVQEGVLVGLITPKDIIKFLYDKSQMKNLPKNKTKISEVMETHFTLIDPDDDVQIAIKKMMDNGVKPVFVTEDNVLKGMLTKRDILEVFI